MVPCGVRALTGLPCPLCGMTTGVLALATGDVGASLAANPGAIAFVVGVALALTGRFGALGRRLLLLRFPALGAMWLFELRRFGVL